VPGATTKPRKYRYPQAGFAAPTLSLTQNLRLVARWRLIAFSQVGLFRKKKIRRQADEFTALRFRRVGWRAFSTKPDVTSSLGRLDLP
jgi:hypothetical protein